MVDPKTARVAADKLAGFAEPNRLRLLDTLRAGPRHVTELAGLLGVEIVNVSHHLGVLRAAGLVASEKRGRMVVYSLSPDVWAVEGGETAADLGWCRVVVAAG